MNTELSHYKRIYFIGIKGVAMTGLAVICKQRGFEVTGSDVAERFITDEILEKNRIAFFDSFNEQNLDWQPDLVIVGTSWSLANVEVAAVQKLGIATMMDSELRGVLSREKTTVAVAGVHGKTTTTALLAHMLSRAGNDPSYLIGTGRVANLPANGHWGAGKNFIVEADEYVRSHGDTKPKFLDLQPAISIITSLEWEHVDVYPTPESIEAAFKQLVAQTTQTVVACGDWDAIRRITQAASPEVVLYGMEAHNQWRVTTIEPHSDRTIFRVGKDNKLFGQFSVPLFGQHNALNALACIVVATKLGLSIEQIADGLRSFSGTQRRFDVSERDGTIFVDDYAHHPTEVRETLRAIRHRYPERRVIVVFQPHMASRTKALLTDFAGAFGDVDQVIVADIFASARESSHDITSEELAAAIKKNHPNVVSGGDLNQVIELLQKQSYAGAVLVTMGAGDVYRVRDKLLDKK
ncbi:MAG: UDP-N-acetylmuramate--L-alanine ligase [Candidatus Buchananbacteria bacterium RIFCSPHIGHO2_01_FULL_47_11b]|uniref:UDP-N-acetylmuramate--L-alanine ligase n=1 Tax=Candidatus Buchananbacteria bacterium RIFCSPHIGHO2_01_FULL_47_11b TaxID=1797537 RepID=A0A1G1Y5S4_9BACT|nr:MAG: UDP-N-acetylmuramate--L-alanine ligase [Candidatus Buchananbacteria bacterium RIFCSPHIGHO2_01_FULL_47_11b]